MKHINEFLKGMHKDNEPTFQPEGTWSDALNIRVINNDDNSYRVESLISTGDTDDFLTITSGTPIGYCTALGNSIVFSVASGVSRIHYITYNDNTKEIRSYLVYKSSSLNFSVDHPIRAIYNEESSAYKRVYWTDNFNAPRVFNIAIAMSGHIASGSLEYNKTYIVREGSITWESTVYTDGDTFTPTGADDLIYTFTGNIYVSEYTDVPFELLDVQPKAEQAEIRYGNLIAGNLTAGLYSFAYRYKDSLTGVVSPFSQPALAVPIHVDNPLTATYFDYQDIQGSGANVATATEFGISIDIVGIDTNYDTIEVAVIQYLSLNVVNRRYIFAQDTITGADMTFELTSNVILETLTLEDMTVNPIPINTVKDIDVVDNILFNGNISERAELTLPADCSGFVQALAWAGFETPGDNYRFIKTGTQILPPYIGINTNDTSGGANNLITGQLYLVEGGDIQVQDSAGTTTYNDGDNFTVNGSPNYATTEDATWTVLSGTPVVYCIILGTDGNTYDNRLRLDSKEYTDYKGAVLNSYFKGYFCNETYRFGIMFYDKKMNPYYVRWIGDYQVSDYVTLGGYTVLRGSNDEKTILKQVFPQIDLGDLKDWFEVATDQEVYDLISGFSIVRCERDAEILAQGILYPMGVGSQHDSVGSASYESNKPIRPIAVENANQDMNMISEMFAYAGITGNKIDAGRKCPYVYQFFSPDTNLANVYTSVGNSDYLRLEGYVKDPLYDSGSGYTQGVDFMNDGCFLTTDGDDRTFGFKKNFEYYPFAAGAKLSQWNASTLTTPISVDGKEAKLPGFERKIRTAQLFTPTSVEEVEYDVPSVLTDTYLGTDISGKFTNYSAKVCGKIVEGADNTPPGAPTTGDMWLINGTPTGLWAGHDNQITVWDGALWIFYDPTIGDIYFSAYTDESNCTFHYLDGTTTDWTSVTLSGIGDIQTTLDNLGFVLPCSITAADKYMMIVLDEEDNALTELSQGTNGFGASLHFPHIKPIVSIVRRKEQLYGGTSDSGLANSIYIPTGHFQKVNATTGTNFGAVQVAGGDCYTQLIDLTRNVVPKFDMLYTPSVADIYGSGDAPGYSHALAIAFPIQSKYNYTLRQGRHPARDSFYPIDINGISGTAGDSRYGVFQDEERLLNQAYSSWNNGYSFPALPKNFNNLSDYPARIRYTNTKVPNEVIDSFRIFLANNFYDLSLNKGEINCIKTANRNLYVWQNQGVSYLPINQRVMISDNLGGELQLGTGQVITQHQIISDTIGTQHMFSVGKSDYTFVWFDVRNRVYCRLRFGGGVEELSIVKGLHQYFHNLFENFDTDITKDNYYDGTGIVTEYNNRFKEFLTVMKFAGATDTINVHLTFNEKLDGFQSFVDQYPNFIFRLNNKLILQDTYKPTIDVTYGKRWLQYDKVNEYLSYFGYTKDSHVEIIVNPNRDIPKIFDNFVVVNGSLAQLEEVVTATDLHAGLDTSIEAGANLHYRYRNQATYSSVPRDTTTEARMRDYYMRARFSIRGFVKRVITEFRQAF